jgi:hypothetical protein
MKDFIVEFQAKENTVTISCFNLHYKPGDLALWIKQFSTQDAIRLCDGIYEALAETYYEVGFGIETQPPAL